MTVNEIYNCTKQSVVTTNNTKQIKEMLEKAVQHNLNFAFIVISEELIRVNEYEIVPVLLNKKI